MGQQMLRPAIGAAWPQSIATGLISYQINDNLD
jgi:hypothetical protein